jgi:hypothetical protein
VNVGRRLYRLGALRVTYTPGGNQERPRQRLALMTAFSGDEESIEVTQPGHVVGLKRPVDASPVRSLDSRERYKQ